MKSRLAALAALSSVLVSGCAMRTVGEAERAVDAKTHDAVKYLDEARQPLPRANISPVRVEEGVWTTSVARRAEHGDPLPHKFESPGVTLVSASPMELFDIGTKITEATGIPVSFSADVQGKDTQAAAPVQPAGSADSTTLAPGAKAPPRAPMLQGLGATSPTLDGLLGQMGLSGGNQAGAQGNTLRAVTGTRTAMKVNHSGRLSQFLNQVGSHFGVGWEYAAGEIHVFRSITRTYTLHALPSDISVKANMDAGNKSTEGKGDTTGSGQSAVSSMQVKIWDEIAATVSGMVGTQGSVNASVSTGTITVTAPVDVVRRVQTYIDGQNVRLTKQVAVSVQVLNVTLNDSDEISLDIQGLFSGSSKYGLKFGNAGAAAATALTTGTPGVNFGILSPTSTFNGSNGVFNALSEKGRVHVMHTASLTTLNGIPAPIQVSNTRNYLEKIEMQAATGNSSEPTVSLTPGAVTTGFNLSVLPRVVDDGAAIMMQFGMNVSELVGKYDGFDQFGYGDLKLQQPNKNSRSFVQQTLIPNGSTLVLTGFEQARNSGSRSGMGHPDNMLLGGSQSGKNTRDVIVVLLTPVLLDARAPLISSN